MSGKSIGSAGREKVQKDWGILKGRSNPRREAMQLPWLIAREVGPASVVCPGCSSPDSPRPPSAAFSKKGEFEDET